MRHNIFLTGATGILGSYLLKSILESTTADVHCLVRADGVEEARSRILSSLGVYDPENQLRPELPRIIPVPGSLTDPHLGLNTEAYARLASSIDSTIHVGALTDLFLNYRRIEPTNVGGARNIIEFCLKTPSKYLCHVSTHTVLGDKIFDKSVIFRESDLDIGQGFDHMSYQHTKFLAEKMVHEARTRGLRWNIMRPGQIFGDSRNGRYPLGHSKITGLFYDIFKTVIESRVALHSLTYFDVVPVDYVAKAIVALGLDGKTFFKTYHLINPDRKAYTDVISLIRSHGYPILTVSQEEYRRRLFEKEVIVNGQEYKSATISAFRWWFKRGIDFYESAATDCEQTTLALDSHGIHCPKLDRDLIGTYLHAGVKMGYFVPVRHEKSMGHAEAGLSL